MYRVETLFGLRVTVLDWIMLEVRQARAVKYSQDQTSPLPGCEVHPGSDKPSAGL